VARFLALDWDQNQLHLIAANVRGTSVQVQRASLWQEDQTPAAANAEELGKLLRERLKTAGIAPAPVLACVGRDRLIVKEVKFPPVPEAEEPAVVRFQTAKELTDSVDDVVIDYMVAPGQEGGERKASALVVRRDQVEAYQKLCQAAGLKLAAMTPRLLGVSSCLRKVIGTTVVTPPPEPADGIIAVVVVGDKTAEVSIFRGEVFLLVRSVPAGNNLAGEVRRNLAVHAGQMPQHVVRAVYVSGKGSGELRERLSEMLDVPVHTFDPFAGAESLELPVGQRGTFAGAMGLLFARAEGELPINFVAPRQPKPPQNVNLRTIRLAVVASVALFVGLVVLGQVLLANYREEVEALVATRKGVENQLTSTRENAKRLKAIDEWDSLVLIDELYDLTARVTDTTALRMKSITVEPLTHNAQSRFAAKVTLKGELRNRGNLRAPLDELVSRFGKDGFYSPEAPKVEGDQFTLVVNVERRAPGEYKYVLKDVTPEEEAKAAADLKASGRGKGGFGKGGAAAFGKGGFGKGGFGQGGFGKGGFGKGAGGKGGFGKGGTRGGKGDKGDMGGLEGMDLPEE
jgi:Tfp pilus assembly PilM family ATPase